MVNRRPDVHSPQRFAPIRRQRRSRHHRKNKDRKVLNGFQNLVEYKLRGQSPRQAAPNDQLPRQTVCKRRPRKLLVQECPGETDRSRTYEGRLRQYEKVRCVPETAASHALSHGKQYDQHGRVEKNGNDLPQTRREWRWSAAI